MWNIYKMGRNIKKYINDYNDNGKNRLTILWYLIVIIDSKAFS